MTKVELLSLIIYAPPNLVLIALHKRLLRRNISPAFMRLFRLFFSLLPRVEMNKMLVDLMVQTWRDHGRAVTLDRNLHKAKPY